LVKNMSDPNAQFITLPNAFQAQFEFIDIQNGMLLATTDLHAPNKRVVGVKLTNNIIDKPWMEIVPETKDSLSEASTAGGKLFVNYLHDATSQVFTYSPDGKYLGQVGLPGLGSVSGFYGKNDASVTYYSYTSFNRPATIYAYDIANGQSRTWYEPNVSFNPDDYITKQVFVPSTDGAQVPLFITYHKDTPIDGNVPTLLYGYGGFSIDMTPSFSTRSMTWMQMGGIYAQACLRGGSEYGEKWHIAGTKLQKQHTFDDFINCAQWLIDNNYTNSKRLAINGGSNGGLLVGACLNQRPDLFAAAVPQVGVMDMLRFSKFTIGRYWTADYGDVNKPDEFAALYKISPYHNIKEVEYPATLITTGDHDDRVYPAHSFKYAAALQKANKSNKPILIRIESKAGHGAGKPISKRLDENADILAFIAEALQMKKISFK
ncbi:S9 family peptidase, partial [bacterium]|nr:S9 family peptidase [bacterium]